MGLNYILDLRDLTDNMFYILAKNDSNINKISFDQIEKHKEIIKNEAEKNNIKLAFELSRDDIIYFFEYNKIIYKESKEDNSVILREGVSPYHFMWHKAALPLEISELLLNENIVNETLEMMGLKKSPIEFKDIEFYIEDLTEKIKEYASRMEFEKCIELRKKLYDLQLISKLYYGKDSNKKTNKNKALIKTKDMS